MIRPPKPFNPNPLGIKPGDEILVKFRVDSIVHGIARCGQLGPDYPHLFISLSSKHIKGIV